MKLNKIEYETVEKGRKSIMLSLNLKLKGFVAGLLATASLAIAVPAQAEISMAGETVSFVIPFSESGGSATWANFYAPFISQTLPGNPTTVVKFMPGGGSTTGANWFQDQAKADGKTIFGTSGSTQFPYLLGDPRVRYEYKDWRIVLASPTGGVAYLPADIGAKFNADPNSVKDVKFIYGSQGATSLDIVPLLAWELLGLNVEPVFGIKGRGDGRLMFERGEANIDYQTSSAYLKGVVPLVEAGTAVPMMSWGVLDDNGNIVRDPTFPDIPTFKEVYTKMQGKEPSGDGWDAWKAFFVSGFAAQKMIFLPKGSSDELVALYSDAFDVIKARPDFIEASDQELGVYPQMTKAAANEAFIQATTITPNAKEYVLKWLKDRYQVEIK